MNNTYGQIKLIHQVLKGNRAGRALPLQMQYSSQFASPMAHLPRVGAQSSVAYNTITARTPASTETAAHLGNDRTITEGKHDQSTAVYSRLVKGKWSLTPRMATDKHRTGKARKVFANCT